MLCHLVAKFVTNAAMWSLNLVQVTESISGSVVPLAMFLIGELPLPLFVCLLLPFLGEAASEALVGAPDDPVTKARQHQPLLD